MNKTAYCYARTKTLEDTALPKCFMCTTARMKMTTVIKILNNAYHYPRLSKGQSVIKPTRLSHHYLILVGERPEK
jgi:hypothetical protein